jgi:hypothetical protein
LIVKSAQRQKGLKGANSVETDNSTCVF